MSPKVVSPAWSFKGWDVWEFIKGRKKTVVTVVAAFVGYAVMDQAQAAIIAGAAVEGVWAVLEYLAKERKE